MPTAPPRPPTTAPPRPRPLTTATAGLATAMAGVETATAVCAQTCLVDNCCLHCCFGNKNICKHRFFHGNDDDERFTWAQPPRHWHTPLVQLVCKPSNIIVYNFICFQNNIVQKLTYFWYNLKLTIELKNGNYISTDTDLASNLVGALHWHLQ